MNKPSKEIAILSIYMEGMAEGLAVSGNLNQSQRILKCSKWLDQLSSHICGQGYIGCYLGDNCTSDHK